MTENVSPGDITQRNILIETEARLRFLNIVLPLIRDLKTPKYFTFYTHDSPDKAVENIPVSSIWLYGSTNKGEAGRYSDIDIAVTFPLVPNHGLTFESRFGHQPIGDWLRRDFVRRYKLWHFGKLPPFYVDIMPYPDPRYIGPDYFKTRRIWDTIVREGRLLWQR